MAQSDRILSVLIVTVLVATSVSIVLLMSHSDETEWPAGNLPAFVSEEQMEKYLEKMDTDQQWRDLDLNDDSAETGSSPNYHSGTNVQVSGVDEMDRVKTDGEYIYIASSDRVSIVLAYPVVEMANVSAIVIGEMIHLGENEQGYIQGIYLYGDLLVVICSCCTYVDQPSIALDMVWWASSEERTMAFVVDVSDPGSPAVVQSAGVSGYVVGTRMIDSKLYMITQESIWRDGVIDVPQIWDNGSESDLGFNVIRFDPNATEVNVFTDFCVLDVVEGSTNTTSILTDYSSVLYVSANNIYLTYVEWDWTGATVDENGATISLEDAEVTTKIFRLHMDGQGVVPSAMGTVEGYPMNQFSMDENDGYLRIATCSGWTDRENMVSVLDTDMNVVGSIKGIALNETIQSSRFVGDTLYLITFLQTDPLFVIDLSDPTEPKILGELVVPGFSSYLHPIDAGHLIGIGMENGTLKVSLYDVSDPEDPKEVATITTDTWAWSSAQWDHKAVLFDQRYGLLAIPVYTYDDDMMYCNEEMFVYSVTAEGIELEARLSNGDNGSSPRAVIIEDVLYTITTSSVAAWDIFSLEEMSSIAYAQPDELWYGAYGYLDVITER